MLKPLIPALLLAASLHAGTPVEVVPKNPQPAGAVIVELDPSASLDQFRQDLGTIDRRAGKRALPALRHAYRRTMFGAAIEVEASAVDEVRRLPYVRAVHPDLTVWSAATPVAALDDVAALHIDAAVRVNATLLPTRGAGIRVGVIDSGIDYTHPALGGGFGPGFKVAGGWDFSDGDADPMDANGHGTHVAGIIAASSAELSGVAPEATLIAYRVLNGMGFGRQSDVIAAIERSIDPNQDGDPSDHLDVINLSLGSLGTADDLPSKAVDRATAAGVVVVVAVGNEGAFASVRSPATARTAISVGAIDDGGAMTTFSSRGPSPQNLELKPDIVAPGKSVVSARLGGGTIPMDGTSMAAPHVAGVAALLVKLNPDWTPGQVKSAMITSAGAISAPVFARAAGRVDAAAAAQRSTFVDRAGLSFGLAYGKTGTWTATRTVKVTNGGTAPRSFDVVGTNLPAGATLVATPAALQLAPGASQTVELRMSIDNASVPFPGDYVYGGGVELRGTETLTLPWMVLRAGRITGRFEGGGMNLRGISGGTTVGSLMYDVDRGEIFGTPGTKWDLFMTTYQPGSDAYADAVWIVAFEDRELKGDDAVVFRRSDASLRLDIDGRDVQNRSLNDLARAQSASYFCVLAIDYTKDGHEMELGYLMGANGGIFVSPLSSSFVIHPIESYIAPEDGRELYNVQHPPLHGVTKSMTLRADRASYTHARLRFNEKRKPDYLYSACLAYDVLEKGPYLLLASQICPAFRSSEPVEIDLYTTSESGTAASGFIFGTDDLVLPTLRGVGGKIVSAELGPSPAAYRISDGEQITLGNHAFFPVSFLGTNGGSTPRFLAIRSGLTGALGDWQWQASMGTRWSMTSAEGELLGSGILQSTTHYGGPLPTPGARFHAVRDGLTVGGRTSRGEIDVVYGTTGMDYRAPSLTSFRIVDSGGRIGDAMGLRQPVALEFSAADWTLDETRPPSR